MNARMDQIKTRLDATTVGPWQTGGIAFRQTAPFMVVSYQAGEEIARCADELDARFIARSREDVAFLLNKIAVVEAVCLRRMEVAESDPDLDPALAAAIYELINTDVVSGEEPVHATN